MNTPGARKKKRRKPGATAGYERMAAMAERIGFASSTVYGWIADEKMVFLAAPDDEVDSPLAHELSPNAVHGVKDGIMTNENGDLVADYQDADYSKIVPLLTAAALQLHQQLVELRARIASAAL